MKSCHATGTSACTTAPSHPTPRSTGSQHPTRASPGLASTWLPHCSAATMLAVAPASSRA